MLDCKALTAAFRTLRKRGLVAHQSFWCCSNCARSALTKDVMKDKLGYVFYHKQETDKRDAGRPFMLYYGAPTEHDDSVDDTLPRKLVGNLIVSVLEAHGLKSEWNGNTCQAIKIGM